MSVRAVLYNTHIRERIRVFVEIRVLHININEHVNCDDTSYAMHRNCN